MEISSESINRKLFLLRSWVADMVRRFFCKRVPTLHKKQLKILLYVASRPDYEIITQTDTAETLNETLTTLNYHFTKLKQQGLLDKNNKLHEKGKKLLRFLKHWDKTFNKKLRAHKIQITLYLSRAPDNIREIKNCILTPFTNKRYEGLKTETLGCQVLFYSSKKAVVILPDIYANNDEEIAAALADTIRQLIEALQMEFTGLKIDDYKPAKFTSMHVAVLDSIIAEWFILKNKRCFSNGRFGVDKSHGRYEAEAEDVKTALADIEVLVKYDDLARENESLRSKIREIEAQLKKSDKNKEGKRLENDIRRTN